MNQKNPLFHSFSNVAFSLGACFTNHLSKLVKEDFKIKILNNYDIPMKQKNSFCLEYLAEERGRKQGERKLQSSKE